MIYNIPSILCYVPFLLNFSSPSFQTQTNDPRFSNQIDASYNVTTIKYISAQDTDFVLPGNVILSILLVVSYPLNIVYNAAICGYTCIECLVAELE